SSPPARRSRSRRMTPRTRARLSAPSSRSAARMHTRRDRSAGPRGKLAGPRRVATRLPGTRPTYVARVPRSGPGVLPHDFYARPTLKVTEELLGKVLVHRTREGMASGVIVEAEAYIGEDDPACHASFGRTARNEPLFGPPGLAYVYLNYGVHYLVNAVTEADGYPGAVLIRALQPLDGISLMRKRRAPDGRAIDEHALCRGPGNLTKALGITIKDNRVDLAAST